MTFLELAIEYVKNKITDLQDEFEHEICVEHNRYKAACIQCELNDMKNVLRCLEKGMPEK